MVTGGAQGIGRGIAVGFAREGARVAVIDRKPDDVEDGCVAEHGPGRQPGIYLEADWRTRTR